MAGKLEAVRDEEGVRHVLDGRTVRSGQGLEVLLPDGQWLIGRYEWSFRIGEAPRLELVLGGEWEAWTGEAEGEGIPKRPRALLLIPKDAVLRWPGEE
jgi:hypothetical protein